MPPESEHNPTPPAQLPPDDFFAASAPSLSPGSDAGVPIPVVGSSVSPTIIRAATGSTGPISSSPGISLVAPNSGASDNPNMPIDTVVSDTVGQPPTATPDFSPASPSVIVDDHSIPGQLGSVPNPGSDKGKRWLSAKALMIVAVIVLLLGGGSAAAYFGYYMNPNTVWQQSLSNTGKGYDRLVSYLNSQSQAHYSGFKESGSFKLVDNGQNFDGTLTTAAEGSTSTSSLILDLGVTKLDLETRTLKAAGASEPDIYLQLSGIKNLAANLGPSFGPPIAALDGHWIVIDHNLLADLQQQLAKQQPHSAQLTWADVYSFLQSASKVNQQYLFTTNRATSVTTVVKNYGKETVDNRQTYHYKVGFVAAHMKAYVSAMCNAMQHSGLGTYIQQQTGQTVTNSSMCKSLEDSANNIKSSDTVDVWADTSHRLLYKVRISDTANPAQNFVDVGLNYQGGDSYPFFVGGQSKNGSDGTATYKLAATLDTKANAININIAANSKGSSPLNLSGSFSVQPSTAKVSVTAPANAMSVTDVLNSLGLGPYLTQLENAATQQGSPSILSTKTPSGAVVGTTGKTAVTSPVVLQQLFSPNSVASYRNVTSVFRLP